MGAVFTQGAQWVRAAFHLHTRADREFQLTGDRSLYGSNYVEALEKTGNALSHLDYSISTPVRMLVSANRVEIISPGHQPNNLTIENIKAGNSNMRNPILASFAPKLLSYRRLESGLLRAFRAWPQIELIDDRAGNLFKVIVAGLQDQTA